MENKYKIKELKITFDNGGVQYRIDGNGYYAKIDKENSNKIDLDYLEESLINSLK